MTVHYTKQFPAGLIKGLIVYTQGSFNKSEAFSFAKYYQDRAKTHDLVTRNCFKVVELLFQEYVNKEDTK